MCQIPKRATYQNNQAVALEITVSELVYFLEPFNILF